MADKQTLIQPDQGQEAISIHLVNRDGYSDWRKKLSTSQRAALEGQKFDASGYQVGIVPDGDGWFAVGGVADPKELSSWCMAKLAENLPEGTYRRAESEPGPALHGWQTAQHIFDRYKKPERPTGPRVLLTKDVKAIDSAVAEAQAVCLVRDLVNTPAEDMGPAALEEQCEKLAKQHSAKLSVTKGDALEQEYPMVHAVGRAAARHHAPRIMHLTWGKESDPVLAIVGKGVCFDSGGLDVKSSTGMLLMKKDMGGAAHAIALAGLVMNAGLPVRLHLLVPAVENAISSNSFRPGDVLKSRKGLTVEIGNTDAEGRLVLCDVLWYAQEHFKPKAMVDLATLTGAIVISLGHHHAGLFTESDDIASELTKAGLTEGERVWRLPLGPEYDSLLKSKFADMRNIGGRAAGSITAAQFLKRFVKEGVKWAHLDIAGVALVEGEKAAHDVSWASGFGPRLLDRWIADNYEN